MARKHLVNSFKEGDVIVIPEGSKYTLLDRATYPGEDTTQGSFDVELIGFYPTDITAPEWADRDTDVSLMFLNEDDKVRTIELNEAILNANGKAIRYH